MKRSILVLIVVGVLGGTLLWATRYKTTIAPQTGTDATSDPAPQSASTEAPAPALAPQHQVVMANVQSAPVETDPPRPSPVAAAPDEATLFRQTVQLLVSPQSSFRDKQAAFRQLQAQGKLDQAIVELEKGALDNPASSQYPVALGEAYIYKIPSAQDAREPAILGLKADQSFDKALELDPANWEAGFYKAASMSHWPEQLNKGSEVVQRFTDLIQQQENLPPRPEFAQSYVLLGLQYQKAGNQAYASQVWQRGASFFPNDDSLRKLSATH